MVNSWRSHVLASDRQNVYSAFRRRSDRIAVVSTDFWTELSHLATISYHSKPHQIYGSLGPRKTSRPPNGSSIGSAVFVFFCRNTVMTYTQTERQSETETHTHRPTDRPCYVKTSAANCYSNSSDSPHHHRAWIVQSHSPGSAHMYPYLIQVSPPKASWLLRSYCILTNIQTDEWTKRQSMLRNDLCSNSPHTDRLTSKDSNTDSNFCCCWTTNGMHLLSAFQLLPSRYIPLLFSALEVPRLCAIPIHITLHY